MDILILHRIPYHKIDYHRGIDHAEHRVTYFGVRNILDTLPAWLPHRQVERPGRQSVFEEAKAWLGAEAVRFDRIISLSEYELLDAARLRAWCGERGDPVPGAPLAQVTLVRDKVQMKRAAAAAGLRVPRFETLPVFLGQRGHEGWSGRTVLKPHSGASSEDVVVFGSALQARNAVLERRSGVARLDAASVERELYEVEEFIAGPVLHFDGLVADGAILALTASRYVGTCLDYANGQPLGSFHMPVSPAARAWTEAALAAVSIRNGSFHLEAIEHEGELVFLEVGNRVGGADVVATFELATGIHMPSHELRILLGESALAPDRNLASSGLWHGWFVVPGHHGGAGYVPFEPIERFRQSPAVVRWNELQPGTPLPRTITYQAHEVPLAGIIATPGAEESRRWMEDLFRTLGTYRARRHVTQ